MSVRRGSAKSTPDLMAALRASLDAIRAREDERERECAKVQKAGPEVIEHLERDEQG